MRKSTPSPRLELRKESYKRGDHHHPQEKSTSAMNQSDVTKLNSNLKKMFGSGPIITNSVFDDEPGQQHHYQKPIPRHHLQQQIQKPVVEKKKEIQKDINFESEWEYNVNGKTQGPYPLSTLVEWVDSGFFSSELEVKQPGENFNFKLKEVIKVAEKNRSPDEKKNTIERGDSDESDSDSEMIFSNVRDNLLKGHNNSLGRSSPGLRIDVTPGGGGNIGSGILGSGKGEKDILKEFENQSSPFYSPLSGGKQYPNPWENLPITPEIMMEKENNSFAPLPITATQIETHLKQALNIGSEEEMMKQQMMSMEPNEEEILKSLQQPISGPKKEAVAVKPKSKKKKTKKKKKKSKKKKKKK